MKITLNFGTVKNGIVDPKVYRTMVRYEDQATKFANLAKSLSEISNRFGINMDQIYEDYAQVCCNLERLVDLYERKRYIKWTPLFDYALAKGPESEFYKTLKE